MVSDEVIIAAMIADWRAFKQAFWNGFFGRPLEHKGTDNVNNR